jgi:hypothetical protein
MMCHVDDDRKERVLHTRVPEKLEHELKERAAELGVSVSNLVRNVLTHAFGLVGDVVADGARVARAATGAPRARAPVASASGDVIGWQQLVLQKNAVCNQCNDLLPRGRDAAIALTEGEGSGPRPIVCLRCLEELRDDDQSDQRRDD